jgi:molybdenum cofactor cytidylyltransferase
VAEARSQRTLAAAVAVIPLGDETLLAMVERSGLEPVPNPRVHAGLSESLRIGLRSLAARPEEEIAAALVFLGDQPLVPADAIRSLIAAWQLGRGKLIRPRYSAAPDSPGHPVLVDRSLWWLADNLRGDAGLGALLPAESGGVTLLALSGSNPDIDTPHDLRTLEEMAQ